MADMSKIDGNHKVLKAKVVLLGDSSVGKSCLSHRFTKNEFSEYQDSTVGFAFATKNVFLPDYAVKFEIWDTAGQERYRSLVPMYYKGAAAVVVVYDITRKESLEGAKSWVQELKNVEDLSKMVIVFVGNKKDLESKRQVQEETAKSFADENNLFYIETSAKNGTNVNEMFREIAKRLPTVLLNKVDTNTGFSLGNNNTVHESKSCSC